MSLLLPTKSGDHPPRTASQREPLWEEAPSFLRRGFFHLTGKFSLLISVGLGPRTKIGIVRGSFFREKGEEFLFFPFLYAKKKESKTEWP